MNLREDEKKKIEMKRKSTLVCKFDGRRWLVEDEMREGRKEETN